MGYGSSFLMLLACGAALAIAEASQAPPLLASHWKTSHSLAVRFTSDNFAADDGSAMKLMSAPLNFTFGEPWWWLVATRIEDGDGEGEIGTGRGEIELPWKQLVHAFQHSLNGIFQVTRVAWNVGGGFTELKDDLGVSDPKVQTKHLTGHGVDVHFRAYPQRQCIQRVRPPNNSFVPDVLPDVNRDHCVIEICGLDKDTRYRLMLFQIHNGSALPRKQPKPIATAIESTHEEHLDRFKALQMPWLAAGYCFMVIAFIWEFYREWDSSRRRKDHKLLPVPASPRDPFQPLEAPGPNDGIVSGFTSDFVNTRFMTVFQHVLVSSTMMLPIIGPLGILFAKETILGARFKKLFHEFENKERKKSDRWIGVAKTAYDLILNFFFIPYNLLAIQELWPILLRDVYALFKMDPFSNASVGSITRAYISLYNVSEMEMFVVVPVTVISAFLLALDWQRDEVRVEFSHHKQNAEELLGRESGGAAIYDKLCKHFFEFKSANAETNLQGRNLRINWRNPLWTAFLLASVVFGVTPRLWMCGKYKVPLFGEFMFKRTVLYAVNMIGLSHRFLLQACEIVQGHAANRDQIVVFQALSWQRKTLDKKEKWMSLDLYDPFVTLNEKVRKKREELQSINERPLELQSPQGARLWWQLRQLVLLDIKDERVGMEMMVLVCLFLFLALAVGSLIALHRFQMITTVSIVSALTVLVLAIFIFLALSDARDINSMCKEHSMFLHRQVTEMQLQEKDEKDEKDERQQRLLLQFAAVIERESAPETVGTFAITPELFSTAFVTIGTTAFTYLVTFLSSVIKLKF